MLAIGEAARYQAIKQLEDLGADTIVLQSAKPVDDSSRDPGVDLLAFGLTFTDLRRIRGTLPTVKSATPMREYRKTVRYQDRKLEARIVGVTPEFLEQTHIRLAVGRNIDDLDERRFDNVAILGSGAAEVLFPTQQPVGRSISIDDVDHPRAFTVIGVTEPKTLAIGSESGDVDYNRVVFIPFATDRVRFGRELITAKTGSFQAERLDISQIVVSVDGLSQREADGRGPAVADRPVSSPQGRDDDGAARSLAAGRADAADVHVDSGRDRRHLARGRRDRDHEHHAGDGDRADARDRHSPCARRPAARHCRAVPGRDADSLVRRRRCGDFAGDWPIARRRPAAEPADVDSALVAAGGVCRLRCRRPGLGHLSRPAGGMAGSD